MAVAEGSRKASEDKKRQELAAANEIADQIKAEEDQAEKKQHKKNKKKHHKKK